MPWVKDEDGITTYKVSLYAKEELPTWDEVYFGWYNGNIRRVLTPESYDIDELDPYWGIPKPLYLTAIVCNQFNKMLFEDGYKDVMLKYINDMKNIVAGGTAVDIRFILEDTVIKDFRSLDEYNILMNRFMKKFIVGSDLPPQIYTIPLPNGQKNPFIVNDHPRVNITDLALHETLAIVPIVTIKMDEITLDKSQGELKPFVFFAPDPRHTIPDEDPEYSHIRFSARAKIIFQMIQPFHSYFGGTIGWKDKDGNPISSDKSGKCPE